MTARPGLLVATVALLAACGGGGETTADGDAASSATSAPTTATTASVEPGTIPFDLGPAVVAGGDDVVPVDGIEVPPGRFVADLGERPDDAEMAAYRLAPDPEAEQRVRAAAAELLGTDVATVDFHVDGARFEFHAEGYGHDDGPPTTVAPDDAAAETVDESDAVASLLRFVDDAGLGPPIGEPTTFESGGFLSVEVGLALVPDATVTRSQASVTFDASGSAIGGFGPVGAPTRWDSFALVGVDTAVRRLELTQALAGYPTTVSTAPGPPVRLVSAEAVLALREVVTADGVPTGESWLVPTWHFTDDAGTTWEVTAVTAGALHLPR